MEVELEHAEAEGEIKFEQSSINQQKQETTDKDCIKNEDSVCNADIDVHKEGESETNSLEGKSKLLNAGASSTDSESSLKQLGETKEAKEPESSHNHSLNGYGLETDSLESDDHTKISDKNVDKDIDEKSSSIGEEKNLPPASSEVIEPQSVNNAGPLDDSTLESVDKDSNEVKQSDGSPPHSRDGSPMSHGHGSHRSPDRETRAEYRKIKEEVTGEGETSESDGDDDADMPGLIDVRQEVKDTTAKDSGSNELHDDTKVTDEGEKSEAANEWVDVLGNGLLKKRVLKAGKGRDTRPDRGQIVMLRMAGRLDDGTAVDWKLSTEFILGEGEVIQALDLAVALMQTEEVCEVVTDGKYAYGSVGRPDSEPAIPPNSKITYELELLCVREGPSIENMEDVERIQIADKKRELGNEMYAKGDYSGAINSYQRAIKYLDPSGSESVQEAKVKCFNNLAAAQLKIKAFPAALSSCARVLQVDPENVKAVFRKGKVLAAQNELTDAIAHIKKASLLDPGNKTIRSELLRLRRLQSAELQKERSMYERMVGGNGKDKKKKASTLMPWSLVIGASIVAVGGIVMAIIFSAKH